MKKLMNLKGAKMLSKVEQKSINGQTKSIGPDPFCGAAAGTYGRASGCVCTSGSDCIMGGCSNGICD